MVISCNAYVFMNCAQWTLEIWNKFTLFLRVNCSRANYVLADLVTQHLSSSTLPEFHSGLKLSSLLSALRILVFTQEQNRTLKSLTVETQITLSDQESGHRQLPNGHFIFFLTLTPSLHYLKEIFCFEYLNSVCRHRGIQFPVLIWAKENTAVLSFSNTIWFSMLRLIIFSM